MEIRGWKESKIKLPMKISRSSKMGSIGDIFWILKWWEMKNDANGS